MEDFNKPQKTTTNYLTTEDFNKPPTPTTENTQINSQPTDTTIVTTPQTTESTTHNLSTTPETTGNATETPHTSLPIFLRRDPQSLKYISGNTINFTSTFSCYTK